MFIEPVNDRVVPEQVIERTVSYPSAEQIEESAKRALPTIFDLQAKLKIGEFLASLDGLSDTVHYEEYNQNPIYRRKAEAARRELIEGIQALGGTNRGTPLVNLGTKHIQAWRLDLGKVQASKEIRLAGGEYCITAAELEALNKTACVSYLSNVGILVDDKAAVLSAPMLKEMLIAGSKGALQQGLAMYRCVSSEVALVRTSCGEPIKRTLNMPLHTFRVYTTNAPNLAYDYVHQKMFLSESQDLILPQYKETLKSIFMHVLRNMQNDNVSIACLPGFGLGAFMPAHLRPQGFKMFSEALVEVLDEGRFTFEGIVFSDPAGSIAPQLTLEIGQHADMPWKETFQITRKSLLDVASLSSSKGIKTGILNAGDPSCVAGQFWQGGHIALEEMYALFSTMVLSQTPTMNPYLLQNMVEFHPNSYQIAN